MLDIKEAGFCCVCGANLYRVCRHQLSDDPVFYICGHDPKTFKPKSIILPEQEYTLDELRRYKILYG